MSGARARGSGDGVVMRLSGALPFGGDGSEGDTGYMAHDADGDDMSAPLIEAGSGSMTPSTPDMADEATIEEFKHPPGNDFHQHEYGDSDEVGQCTKCMSKDPPELSSFCVRMAFLSLGAAPSLTWMAAALAEEYLETILGPTVLMDLGFAQASSTLLSMLFFHVVKNKLDARLSVPFCLVAKAVVTLLVPIVIAVTGSVSPPLLYGAILVNGTVQGVVQSQIAAVCGLLPGSRADGLTHIGSFVAGLVLTLMQTGLLAVADVIPGNTAKARMYILFFGSGAFIVYSCIAQHQVLQMPSYARVWAAEQRRVAKLDKRVGAAKVVGRIGTVWWYLLGELVTWLVALFLTAISPYVKSTSNSASWRAMFATVLIILWNLFNFVGSNLARRIQAWEGPALVRRLTAKCGTKYLLGLSCGGRLLFCAFFVLYINQGGFGLQSTTADATVMALYVLAAATNGYFTVALSAESQRICGFNARHLCPVVAALVWLAMQVGVVAGVGISFAVKPLLVWG